jgi:hypothetical protein
MLAILVRHPSGEPATAIATQLAEMGADMTGWRPQENGDPARAFFRFHSEEDRAQFIARALGIPGVSLTPMESQLATSQGEA